MEKNAMRAVMAKCAEYSSIDGGGGLANAAMYRFGSCEIDEARRSLNVRGREIRLQPLVFDLLCHLVRHRERVVGKDELLDTLWPRTIVVDNALQRVVSLARAALAEAGLGDAIRTYPRHGYRFCLDESVADDKPAALVATDYLTTAHAAVERMDWVAACDAYAAADVQSALDGEEVEQWGRAAISAGRGPSAIAALERSAARRDAAGDSLGAARVALLVVQVRIDQKQGVLANGLMHRVSRQLDAHHASIERGHYAWMASRMALGGGDVVQAFTLADEAYEIGRTLRNRDVECLGLVYRGHALIAQGSVAEGIAQHEEAAAALRLGKVTPWVIGWALCGILYAARHRCDWVRAAQFAEAYAEWTRATHMIAFPGTCQLHHAAVLGVQGELERAAQQVRDTVDLLTQVAPYAEGDACNVLGDIQICMGDFTGAEESYRRAHALGWDPQPGLARLHLLTGRAQDAQRGLELALAENDWTLRERRAQLLCILVRACVAAGDIARAREAMAAVDADPQMIATEALKGMHCEAQAELAFVDLDLKCAVQKLRQAVRHWRDVGSPSSEFAARLRLAECLWQMGDAAARELELHAVESSGTPCVAIHQSRIDVLREGVGVVRRAG